MIEALAAGLAVIVTRVGTIPDFLTNKNAILIRVKDVNGLQCGIRNLVTDEPLRYTLPKMEESLQRKISPLKEKWKN